MHIELKVPKKRSAWAFLSPFRAHVALYALIPSETDPNKAYDVAKFENLWGKTYKCSCPDHFWRGTNCKHIAKLKYAEQRQYRTAK